MYERDKGALINHVDSEGGRGVEAGPSGQNFSQTTALNAVLLSREIGYLTDSKKVEITTIPRPMV